MPVKDCITGSPFCTNQNYEEFRDPVLSQHAQTTGRKETRHIGIPKFSQGKRKGEHNGKIWKFAEGVHVLKERTLHHM